MGYDMYIETDLTEDEALVKSIASQVFEIEVKKRDALTRNTPEWEAAQDAVMNASSDMDRANKNYFRLNIWGMGKARAAMQHTGMLYDSTFPEFPEHNPPTSAEGGKEGLHAAEDAYDAEYQAACRPVQEHHPEGDEVIPLHKLCDNSGWLVTEEECAAAVKAYRAWLAADEQPGALAVIDEAPSAEILGTLGGEWWPDWIAFIDRAATRGGFRVY